MTIWSMAQVNAVMGLRVDALVADEMIASAKVNIGRITVEAMFDELANEVKSLAVEIYPPDLVVSNWSDELRGAQHYRVYWGPPTENAVVELMGGARDGERMTVKDIYDPLILPHYSPLEVHASAPDALAYDRLVYGLSGWHEQERHWVFALATP